MTLLDERTHEAPLSAVTDLFDRVRAQTLALAAPLSPEDMGLQSMEDASPRPG